MVIIKNNITQKPIIRGLIITSRVSSVNDLKRLERRNNLVLLKKRYRLRAARRLMGIAKTGEFSFTQVLILFQFFLMNSTIAERTRTINDTSQVGIAARTANTPPAALPPAVRAAVVPAATGFEDITLYNKEPILSIMGPFIGFLPIHTTNFEAPSENTFPKVNFPKPAWIPPSLIDAASIIPTSLV